MNIDKYLNNYIDLKYKAFNMKLIKTKYNILGIKVPILKDIAKKLLKEYNYQDILNNLNDVDYEHVLLQGLIIAYTKLSYKDRLLHIDNYIHKIDNWAICDTFCSSLKFINKNKKEFLKYIEKYLNSDKEYYLRFGIVILLDYYINDDYIDYVLNKCLSIKSDYYYVKMAISWTLSVCLIKYFDKTIMFLNDNKNILDKWTYNKALQKGIESYRISDDNKIILRSMKI